MSDSLLRQIVAFDAVPLWLSRVVAEPLTCIAAVDGIPGLTGALGGHFASDVMSNEVQAHADYIDTRNLGCAGRAVVALD